MIAFYLVCVCVCVCVIALKNKHMDAKGKKLFLTKSESPSGMNHKWPNSFMRPNTIMTIIF